MTQAIESLSEVASAYDAIVLDQWGVLHDGSTPYPGVVAGLKSLARVSHRFAVLSNSGKRSAPNAARIAGMGFDGSLFAYVMTSGEAMWINVQVGAIAKRAFFPIERSPGDAALWARGLDVNLVPDLAKADAVLLMGLPDGATLADWDATLKAAKTRDLPVYCTNPDKASPRAGGVKVISPGALAAHYEDLGGQVVYFGKPHRPIFDTLAQELGAAPKKLLMVGDSLEHDIAGAANAGWDSLFIRGGLYRDRFADGSIETVLDTLLTETGGPAPTYTLEYLK